MLLTCFNLQLLTGVLIYEFKNLSKIVIFLFRFLMDVNVILTKLSTVVWPTSSCNS
jgi:hypothetical protein